MDGASESSRRQLRCEAPEKIGLAGSASTFKSHLKALFHRRALIIDFSFNLQNTAAAAAAASRQHLVVVNQLRSRNERKARNTQSEEIKSAPSDVLSGWRSDPTENNRSCLRYLFRLGGYAHMRQKRTLSWETEAAGNRKID